MAKSRIVAYRGVVRQKDKREQADGLKELLLKIAREVFYRTCQVNPVS